MDQVFGSVGRSLATVRNYFLGDEEDNNMSKHIYLRNFIFGVEDSLVSTVGLLSGVAIAGVPAKTILLTGTVLIFVEAFSMAVGSFLSEHSVDAYLKQGEAEFRLPIIGGLGLVFFFFFSCFIPLGPYLLTEPAIALKWSIGLSLISLFILGIIGAKLSSNKLWNGGFRMAMVGGIAIALGVIVGKIIGH